MLMDLLRGLYAGTPLPAVEGRYEDILGEIELFGISSQVFHLLRTHGRTGEVPAPFRHRLQERYVSGLQHNKYMKRQEEELLQAFDEAGIRAMPLKGVNFAVRYFGHIGARITGDLDICVPRPQLEQAIRCAEASGYRFEIVKDHHARLHRHELLLELHWALDKMHWSDLDGDPFWATSDGLAPYRGIRTLSTAATFYFICLHGARHQMDSVRYVLDVVQMLERSADEIDYAALFRQAKRDRTYRRIRTVLSIVYEQFPHLQRSKPLGVPLLRSGWNYASVLSARQGVKDRRYYRYKLHFKHLMHDSVKFALRSIRKSY